MVESLRFSSLSSLLPPLSVVWNKIVSWSLFFASLTEIKVENLRMLKKTEEIFLSFLELFLCAYACITYLKISTIVDVSIMLDNKQDMHGYQYRSTFIHSYIFTFSIKFFGIILREHFLLTSNCLVPAPQFSPFFLPLHVISFFPLL